jgi:hypothetical protein
VVTYGFGDASKSSFRATVQEVGDRIECEYRQWCREVGVVETSMPLNWRDLNNLVHVIKMIVARHDLRGCEFLIFTDNTMAENAFWKEITLT